MSQSRKQLISGWLVFAIAFIVYLFSAEPTGSLWDCGEFVAGAHKLQVVHPPGAPLFLIIGRMFAIVGEMTGNPENIAFAVNLLSSVCTAFAAAFIAWVTFMMGQLTLVGRREQSEYVYEENEVERGVLSDEQSWVLFGAALVAGLCTAFSTSIWFSAVEGEVYAMSTFFTALTLWSTAKWYTLPKDPKNDSWLIFSIFAIGLSVGVHLLSLLAYPLIALLYYYKKYEKITWKGIGISIVFGMFLLYFTQKLVIAGIPSLWLIFERLMVNGMGLPVHTGLIPLLGVIGAAVYFSLRYAHKKNDGFLQKLIIALTLIVVGYSSIGVVITRSGANTPINMSKPDNAARLVPYVNREQYGDRPLVRGPQFNAEHDGYTSEDRYDYVDGEYQVVDQKVGLEYDASDKVLFPRMSDRTQGRPDIYKREWMNNRQGTPTMGENLKFFFNYQIGWMYVRYFMWNFSGRQNGMQGFTAADKSRGNWITGIKPIDELRLHNMDELTDAQKNNQARNKYYMLPFLFGLLGMFFHYNNRRKDFGALLFFFILAGIGIIIQSNQPPREPRERDYVLVGSFMTFCVWIGLAVPALYSILREKGGLGGMLATGASFAVIMAAPLLMGFQNFDDHSRKDHFAARDYASNFLNSVEKDAILFTYGDNDTYPLWYAQEVEGIRTDVRVVNLSLIAVDWYINLLRRKINDSPPIKLTVTEDGYRGRKRIQVPVDPTGRKAGANRAMSALDAVKFVAEDHSAELGGQLESYLPAKNLYIPVDRSLYPDSNALNRLDFTISGNNMFKGDLAVLDILASNLWERPIYFAVTARTQALLGLQPYLQLEGMAQRVVPYRTAPPNQNPYGMVGLGRVAEEKNYDLFTNTWRWGNFDKEETFINSSYTASVQSMQLVMNRTAETLLRKGKKEKAIEVAETYFMAFPDFNFPYSYSEVTMIRVLVAADAYDKAKEHMRILAKRTADEMEFLESLDQQTRSISYRREDQLSQRAMAELLNIASQQEDTEMLSELEALFSPFQSYLDEEKRIQGGS